MRAVLQQVFSHVVSDSKVVRTARDLLIHPARLIGDYIGGKTAPYTEPTKYFLLCITLAQLVSLWTGAITGAAEGFVDGGGTSDSGAAGDASAVAASIEQFYVIGAALLVPVFAFFTRLLFRLSGYNYAEHVAFHLYAVGQAALLWAVLLLSLELLPSGLEGALIYVLTCVLIAFIGGLYAWSGARFFSRSLWRGLLGMLLVALLGLLGSLILGAIATRLTS